MNLSLFPRPLRASCALFLSLFLLTTALRASDVPCGRCFSATPDGKLVALPLELTEVVMDIQPGLIEAEVIQTFTNRTGQALEATYAYPLPAGATVSDFKLRFADRVVKSVVKEKAAAKEAYETAKAEGKKAALMTQADPSVFTTTVANFLPGETVHVVIRYLQPLEISTDMVKVSFPMVSDPKYYPAGTAPDADATASEAVTRWIAGTHSYAFDIKVSGLPVQKIQSPTHEVRVETLGDDVFAVSLAKDITTPDRDFVLQIHPRPLEKAKPMVVTEKTATGNYGIITVFPPSNAPETKGHRKPRDILFLVDHSGSMEGERMRSADLGLQKSLRRLHREDRFKIMIFDDVTDTYEPMWLEATPGYIEAACNYAGAITARGGTEAQAALKPALESFEPNDHEHYLVFLTDGDVGGEPEMVHLIREGIQETRLFTFGIGNAPNQSLLQKMAEVGRGQMRTIMKDDQVDETLDDFFSTLDAPVMTNLQLQLLDANRFPLDATFFPKRHRDLFLRTPLKTTYRLETATPAFVRVTGDEQGKTVSWEVPLPSEPGRGHGIEKDFGNQWFEELTSQWHAASSTEEALRLQALRLKVALLFELVTDVTSRVAIEQRISRDPNAPLTSQLPVKTVEPDDDTIELTPFTVSCAENEGYIASSSIAGTRIRTDLRDVASAITVVTKEFLEDTGATSTESLLRYLPFSSTEAPNAHRGVQGNFMGSDLVTTLVDVNSLCLVTFDPTGSGPCVLDQRLPQKKDGGEVLVRSGQHSGTSGSLSVEKTLTQDKSAGALLVLSANTWEGGQKCGYLAVRKETSTVDFDLKAQALDYSRYGTLRDVHFTANSRSHDGFVWQARAASSSLKRDNARQFASTVKPVTYENLGFWDLDLVTGPLQSWRTSSFDGVAGWTKPEQTLLFEAGATTQRGTWEFTKAGTFSTAQDHFRAGLDGSRHLISLPLVLEGEFKAEKVELTNETESSKNTYHSHLKVKWSPKGFVSVYGIQSFSTNQPLVPSGIFAPSGLAGKLVTSKIESHHTSHVGALLDLFYGRLTVDASLYRDEVEGLPYRDWEWEAQSHASSMAVTSQIAVSPDFVWRSSDRFETRGFQGRLDLQPTPYFKALLSWDLGFNNEGPVRGGQRKVNLILRYDFSSGYLRGFSAGFSGAARNTLTFGDGYQLPGGARVDLFVSYERKWFGSKPTNLQLNFENMGNVPWQLTRFSPDHGRQMVFSVSQSF